MKMTSPTQLSLKEMRARGYFADVVAYWNHYAKRRVDMLGFIDILCLGDKEIIGVQSTDYTHVSHRREKILNHDNLVHCRRAGIKILVHGWHKKDGRWTVREVEI